ncbi:MAG: hypothetical protein ACR5LG_14565 [Sodalis sp. (in: enterobacteria)]|uniref:hypothetical protein n=1 Tax=Sodalis sp. (in: enterobacteria) TaxID=1898979 RepID=UPI003F3A05FD
MTTTTTTVINGDNCLTTMTATFSISRNDKASGPSADRPSPAGAAKAAILYHSLMTRTLLLPAENALHPAGGKPEV